MIYLVLIYLLLSPLSRAQWQTGARDDFNPVLAARLQFLLDSINANLNFKGVSASVYVPAEGIWTGVTGVSHGNVNITPGMKFGIASNTKTFIAVLMLKLQELNILSLDDSLDRWLPNFQYVDSTITIRQLLNHTSGVYNFNDYPGFNQAMADTGRYWTPEEILNTFMDSANFLPGQSMSYSNTGYILAGMIIKAATASTVSNKLRQLILNPLNLNSTFLPPEESVPDTIAHGWANGVEFRYPITSFSSAFWTSGAMYSTAENLARWYRDLFSLQIINQSSLNQMLTFTPQSNYIYGLGITRRQYEGTKWGHDGDIRGYTSRVEIDSTTGYTIAILINQTPALTSRFVNTLGHEIRNFIVIGLTNYGTSIPRDFKLYQNYPNPFNPVTAIRFGLPKLSHIRLVIYDVLGKETVVLVNEVLKAGEYKADWDASEYSSGVYFYKLTSENYSETKRMVLIK